MPTPWICDRCGEVAQGDMCRACGNSKGHGPIVKDDRVVGYDARPLTDSPRAFPVTWGPIAWVALVFFLGLVAMAYVTFPQR